MRQNRTAEERIAGRYIPQNTTAINEESGLGVVYVGPAATRDGYFVAIAYAGTASKSSFHYIYKSEKQLDDQIERFFSALRENQERVAKYRAARYAGHSFKVGDIISNSWGYDQTNVDWYRVVKTSKNYVWLQSIASSVVETGFMCGNSTPSLESTGGPITRHQAEGERVNMRYGSGSKWDGKSTVRASWYA